MYLSKIFVSAIHQKVLATNKNTNSNYKNKQTVKENISFNAKKPVDSAEVEKFKILEALSKKQRESLPLMLQISYPLSLYPKIKRNDVESANLEILQSDNLPLQLKDDIDAVISKNDFTIGAMLQQKESDFLDNVINSVEDFENNSFMGLFKNIFSDTPVLDNKSGQQKADLLKTIKALNIDGSVIKAKLIPEYNSLIEYAKLNKESLTEPVQEVMEDSQIEEYFDKNAIPILKALIIIDPDSLKLRLTQRLNKFDRTISSVDTLLQNNEINENLLQLSSKNSKQDPFEMTKIIELLAGIQKLGVDNNKINSYIETANNPKIDKVEFLSRMYLQELYALNDMELMGDWNKDFVYTIPSFLDDGSEWHKDQFFKLLSLDGQAEYLDLLHNSSNSFGVANQRTKEIFGDENLDYEKWLNYDGEQNLVFVNKRLLNQRNKAVNRSKIKPNENLSIRIWKRNPPQDLFQGSTAVQCIALDGINKNAAVDELVYTYAQLVELYNEDKNRSVGNACVYWIKDENNQKALLIDSVSVHPDYKNDYPLRQALFGYVKEYASNVAGCDVPVYIGNQFNKFSIEDLPLSEQSQFLILGNSANNDVYLDAIIAPDAQSRYVTIDEDKKFTMDLREIK